MISRDILQEKFKIFIFLTLFILLTEVVGGIISNSLALLSDAAHVFIDLLALLLVYFSIWLARKRPTKKFTFGFYRSEILAAIINGAALIFIVFSIFYYAYLRFLSPQPIKGPEMLIVAIIGFVANFYIIIKMHGFAKENLSIRGAYLHVLADTLSSIGVVVAAILIVITGHYIFDSIISVMIGLFVLVQALRLIKDSTYILLETTPKTLNLEKISQDIQKIKGIKNIHDLHIWSISSDVYALSCHIVISAENLKLINKITSDVSEMIKSKYNITHTVIQSECEGCADINHFH